MNENDDFDSAWDRMSSGAPDRDTSATAGESAEGGDDSDGEQTIEAGPPLQVSIVIKADKVPVAPWAQGWQVGSIGPIDGLVTMVFVHEIVDSPVAQLSAITGLLSTVKAAALEIVWWGFQARGPLPIDTVGDSTDAEKDFDQQLSDFLIGGESTESDS